MLSGLAYFDFGIGLTAVAPDGYEHKGGINDLAARHCVATFAQGRAAVLKVKETGLHAAGGLVGLAFLRLKDAAGG